MFLFLSQAGLDYFFDNQIIIKTELTDFIYLPHAGRILLASLLGWASIPGILVATFFVDIFIQDQVIGKTYLSLLMLTSVSAPMTFWLLKWVGIKGSAFDSMALNWKHLLLSGLIATIIQTVIDLWGLHAEFSIQPTGPTFLWLLATHIAGLILIMFTLPILIRMFVK